MSTSLRVPGPVLREVPVRSNEGRSKSNSGASKVLEATARFALRAGNVAAEVTGGPLAGQLARELTGAAGLGGGTINGGFLGGGDFGVNDGFSSQLELLDLQRQIQTQQQTFQTLTNISKSSHDARMAAVRNMRP